MKATPHPKIDALKKFARGELSKEQLKTMAHHDQLCSINGVLHSIIEIDELLVQFNDKSELKRYTDTINELPSKIDVHETKDFIELSLGILPCPDAVTLEPVEGVPVIELDWISVKADIEEIRRNDFTLIQKPSDLAYLGILETVEEERQIEEIQKLRNQLHTNYQNNIEHEKDIDLF